MVRVESLVEEGIGDNRHFRDIHGRRVEVSFLSKKCYKREDVSKLWSEIKEDIPEEADARYIRKIEKARDSIYYYIEYYKIVRRL